MMTGYPIDKAEERGIQISQLRNFEYEAKKMANGNIDVFDPATKKYRKDKVAYGGFSGNFNMYHACDNIIKPRTEAHNCSWVEFIAKELQIPLWFVSHAWSTALELTVRLLLWHMAEREESEETPYWICTFANNQHHVELGNDIQSSPFYKAIMTPKCKGTVLILDDKATPFTRMWCVLENHVSTAEAEVKGKKHLYDVAAWVPEGQHFLNSEKLPAAPTLRKDLGSGRFGITAEVEFQFFPLSVAERAVKMNLSEAQASNDHDKTMILDHVAGPARDERKIKDLNQHAQRLFASAAMYDAAGGDDVEKLLRLVEAFPGDVNGDATGFGATACINAASYGKIAALEVLIAHRADVNLANNEGTTPLYMALLNGKSDAVKVLIAHSADVNVAEKYKGTTPLWAAARQGHPNEVKVLIAIRADVNHASFEGSTPCSIAAESGNTDALEVLLANSADVNLAINDGATPLSVAAQMGHTDAIKVLIAHRADLNLAKTDGFIGFTPLIVAALEGQTDAIKVLIAVSADVNHATIEGVVPLHAAALKGRTDAAKELIAHNADVNLACNEGGTACKLAAEQGHVSVIKVLLANGTDVNHGDKDGDTPCSGASFNGHIELLKVLIANRADVNAANHEGTTPYDCAVSNGHDDVVQFFKDACHA